MQEDITQVVSAQIGGKTLTISTGELARQADGAVVVQYGDTVVLGTAVMGKPLSPDGDFLPLLVEYSEKFYAAGKIKGSRFIKREGRPTDEAILTSRLIDRSLRPLFPEGMINDVQVVLTVLSYDKENTADIPAMVAAFGALMVSGIPWQGPLGAVRVARVNDQFVINPTDTQMQQSTLDLVVAGNGSDVTMIESGAHELTEALMLDALEEGQKAIKSICDMLIDLQKKVGKPLQDIVKMKRDEEVEKTLYELASKYLPKHLDAARTKDEIGQAERDTVADVLQELTDTQKELISEQQVRRAIHDYHGVYTRDRIIQEGIRSDGRALDQIRRLKIKAGVLPRTHGSGLFQRGDTQILTTLTLGGPGDVQILDSMEEEDTKKHYMHFYNFPGFSVGEVKPSRGPGRREIGHGALAERALLPVLPPKETWPYTMMLVSEVLESHGSSSMASVCGSSLALMDGGVPISKPVAGIAMGLMTDGKGNYQVLTDIAGIEDEQGDMDFKVAGTRDGITAIQMDIKVTGLTRDILAKALDQAQQARLHILAAMDEVLSVPRSDMSPYAPRIEVIQIPVEKIGDLIGPKGKHINEIIEQTGVEIDIEDTGLVSITSNDAIAMQKAKDWVHNMTREMVPGEKFDGRVTRIMDFGAFVELVPGVEGMVHISQFSNNRVEKIEDVVKVGDIIPVVVVEIDSMGRINLSHKAALPGGSLEDAKRSRVKPNGRSGRPRPSGPFTGPKAPNR